MPTLLLIDDEPAIQHAVRKAFHAPEYETITARSAAEGLALLASSKPDVIVLDVHLPDADGLTAFDRIKAVNARLPIVLVTGHGTTELAIEAMKRGAFDYLLKPLRYEQLKEAIDRASAFSRLMTVPALMPSAEPIPERADALLGRCGAMQEVYKAVGRVAGTDTTVLISGESGTGKELVARAVYQHSRRSGQAFLALNCAAIPDALVESELFGHEKGAFTGAERKRIGKFEQCNGGTLLLDEVGELPPLVQGKLLRLLQDQSFERVGGNETIRVDVRIIAATNADLESAVAAGKFRTDLFFRLNVFAIRLPPLRDRGDDIELLTDYYVARFAREFGQSPPVIPPEARAALKNYSWPGNVRELQSVLKQGLLRASGALLLPEYLAIPASEPASVRPALDWDAFIEEHLDAQTPELYALCLAEMERQLLTRVLERSGGKQLHAAERLGITRSSLRHKLRALGLIADKNVLNEDDAAD